MYERHFGLRENPFAAGHQSKFVYPSREHQEALAHLRFGIENREAFVLITGEVGTGKTTALYDALSEWKSRAVVALITNSALTRGELYEEICMRFGVPLSGPISKPMLIGQLERHLLAVHARGEYAILLIDEAQNLDGGLLEETRLLSNLEAQGQKILQIFLVGQPELEEKLGRPELRQLKQRIAVHYRLRPLSPDDTEHYIHHRISVAGGHALTVFPADSCLEVHRATHGIPREINTLAAQAMLNAFVEDSSSVRPEHVRAIVRDTGFRSVLDDPGSSPPRDASPSPSSASPTVAAAGLPAPAAREVAAPPSTPAVVPTNPPSQAAPASTREVRMVPAPAPPPSRGSDPAQRSPSKPEDPAMAGVRPAGSAETWQSWMESLSKLPAPETKEVDPSVVEQTAEAAPPAPAEPMVPAGPAPDEVTFETVGSGTSDADHDELVAAAEAEWADELDYQEATSADVLAEEAAPSPRPEPMETMRAEKPPESPSDAAAAQREQIARAARADVPGYTIEKPPATPAMSGFESFTAPTSPPAESRPPMQSDLRTAPPEPASPRASASQESRSPSSHEPRASAEPKSKTVMPMASSVTLPPAPRFKPAESGGPTSAPVLSPRLRERLEAAERAEAQEGNRAKAWMVSAAVVVAVVVAVVLWMRFRSPTHAAVPPANPPVATMPAPETATPTNEPATPAAPKPTAAVTPPASSPPPTASATTVRGSSAQPSVARTSPTTASRPTQTTTTRPAGTPSGSSVAAAPQATSPAATQAATAPPKPTAPKPVAPKSAYGISVASFIVEDRANTERERLAAATGLPARVVASSDGDFRVVLGSFPDRAAAENAAGELIGSGKVDEARVVSLGAPAKR